jgi:hypothetical protein
VFVTTFLGEGAESAPGTLRRHRRPGRPRCWAGSSPARRGPRSRQSKGPARRSLPAQARSRYIRPPSCTRTGRSAVDSDALCPPRFISPFKPSQTTSPPPSSMRSAQHRSMTFSRRPRAAVCARIAEAANRTRPPRWRCLRRQRATDCGRDAARSSYVSGRPGARKAGAGHQTVTLATL